MTPLHSFGEAVRLLLQGIPLPMVRVLFVGSLVMLIIWVLRLPRSETTPPEGVKRWDEQLKIGAVAALVIQVLLYLVM